VSEPSFHQQAVFWGQAYEVLAKRGGLQYLLERQLIRVDRPSLNAWRAHKLLDVIKAMHAALGLTDPEAPARVVAAMEHMALTAFGTGYTAMRAYIEKIEKSTRSFSAKKLMVKALWCPLTLPGTAQAATDEERSERRKNLVEDFASEFGIEGFRDLHWAAKGQPANADFILWLDYGGKSTHLLVQEYSFDMPGELMDFREQDAHLQELQRFRRIVDSRGVFARVTAEVEQEQFELADAMWHYLLALTGENKPLYKLFQASSYATNTAKLLQNRAGVQNVIMARALAITPNGIESLGAHIGDATEDPRYRLMQQLAAAYQKAEKLPDGDKAALTQLTAKVFNGALAKLPKALRSHMKSIRDQQPEPGQDYEFSFEERMGDFYNPDDTFSIDEVVNWIPSSQEIDDYFGGDARAAILQEMSARLQRRGKLSLRDIHASAVVAGLQRAQRGALNLIALEGNPGIGKTTAVREYLASKDSGYLFLYLSPRVVINRDVASSLARSDGRPSGILTLTTNAQLNAAVGNWHQKQVEIGNAPPQKVSGAVVADGVPNLIRPKGSVLVITPEQEQEVDDEHTASKFRKKAISEYEDRVQDRDLPGVLRTLAATTREIIALNPGITRLVLTAALQGFKERADCRTTISGLSGLFANNWNTLKGIDERRDFARSIPTVVVMVDELTGDGAGAPFVHAIAAWLRQEFLDPFESEPSPFAVILIASDASLGNEVVFDRYLNAGERTPNKVLISKSRGKKPFDLAVTNVAVDGRKIRSLHVMTNSFPASGLTLRYSIRMTNVHPKINAKGELQTVNQAILEHSKNAMRNSACTEILKALDSQASQVIYFGQDKSVLRDIKAALTTEGGLPVDSVQILDSSVPGHERKHLVEPAIRDHVLVFLMSSSGARGVSFPKTDWIIASIPRFSIEAQLMEIAQLVYRGRGKRKDEFGNEINGDTIPRTLVFAVDDFLFSDEVVDKRQWLMQSLDLVTMLVMLRSTVFTRITGDAGLMQPLALVPVGAVGVEELVSIMSQYVRAFLKEGKIYRNKHGGGTRTELVSSTLKNIEAIFTRTDLNGSAKPGSDPRSYVRQEVAQSIRNVTSNSIRSLIQHPAEDRPLLPSYTNFFGPIVLENWASFEKREIFAFEEHDPALNKAMRDLKSQLLTIKEDKAFPSSLRNPADALLQILYREAHDGANEFKTIKDLKSPNTWVSVPADYLTLVAAKQTQDGREFSLENEEVWRNGLARTLGSLDVAPPIPSYKSFPWAAAVGRISPMNLDLVFDDRYFMASNELNLLNTLLLSCSEADDEELA
jgi:hypothetical protein